MRRALTPYSYCACPQAAATFVLLPVRLTGLLNVITQAQLTARESRCMGSPVYYRQVRSPCKHYCGICLQPLYSVELLAYHLHIPSKEGVAPFRDQATFMQGSECCMDRLHMGGSPAPGCSPTHRRTIFKKGSKR